MCKKHWIEILLIGLMPQMISQRDGRLAQAIRAISASALPLRWREHLEHLLWLVICALEVSLAAALRIALCLIHCLKFSTHFGLGAFQPLVLS